jgi:hypothetical protein
MKTLDMASQLNYGRTWVIKTDPPFLPIRGKSTQITVRSAEAVEGPQVRRRAQLKTDHFLSEEHQNRDCFKQF